MMNPTTSTAFAGGLGRSATRSCRSARSRQCRPALAKGRSARPRATWLPREAHLWPGPARHRGRTRTEATRGAPGVGDPVETPAFRSRQASCPWRGPVVRSGPPVRLAGPELHGLWLAARPAARSFTETQTRSRRRSVQQRQPCYPLLHRALGEVAVGQGLVHVSYMPAPELVHPAQWIIESRKAWLTEVLGSVGPYAAAPLVPRRRVVEAE